MKTYRWIGPVQSVCLQHEGQRIDVMLITGRPVELPEQHPTVQGWLAAGHLQEVKSRRARGKTKEDTDA